MSFSDPRPDEQTEELRHPDSSRYFSSGQSVIRIEHLTKTFRDKQRTVNAVDDITFDVKRGEIFGLLGPNGAGKSTLIRILTTLLSPSSGTAFVGEYEITRDPGKIRGIIGVCPQNSTLDNELTAYHNLEFYGKLEDVDDRILPDRIWELLAMVGMTDRAHMKVRTFSGGMKRKLEIVRAFIHRPLILFLDEPTIGLDPESRREVWQQIETLNADNTTIILTTHYMDEAEKLCSRIAFVDRGRLIALDTMDNLRLLLPAGDLIAIGFDHMDERVLPALREQHQVISAEVKDHKLLITTKNENTILPAILAILERYSVTMNAISIQSPTLEDVFIYLTGKNLNDSGGNEGIPGGREPS